MPSCWSSYLHTRSWGPGPGLPLPIFPDNEEQLLQGQKSTLWQVVWWWVMENENASAYVLLTSPEGSPRGLHYEWSGAQYGSLLQFNLLPGRPPAVSL